MPRLKVSSCVAMFQETTDQVSLNNDPKKVNGTKHRLDQKTSISCPQRSVDRAEFQDNTDKRLQQSEIVSEIQGAPQMGGDKDDRDLNDLALKDLAICSGEMADTPKQAPFLHTSSPDRSRSTKSLANRLPRNDSLETFTGVDDNSSQLFRMDLKPSRKHQRQRSARNAYGPENDWVCVPTKKHPGEEKPLHHGKIRSFRNLFENSFRMIFLFDPTKSHSQSAYPIVRLIKFDGSNVELFREFEQSVLIRIINNDSLDFDSKFLGLLDTLGGSPLAVVQSFTEELDAANFVRAIEALYYAYGEPTKFRNALIRQLINEDPLDMKNPESFLKINSLITRIYRAFEVDGDNQALSMSCILQSIRMTPETTLAYRTWLCSSMKEKSLEALQQWLEWMYQENISENFFRKSAQGFRNVECPPIISNVVHTNFQELLKGRCRLCFEKMHKLEGCHIYMSMTPNQRKIALSIYRGCFRCTRIVSVVHIGSNCNFCEQRDCWRPCENCQSSDHHFSICEASDEPFTAVLKQ